VSASSKYQNAKREFSERIKALTAGEQGQSVDGFIPGLINPTVAHDVNIPVSSVIDEKAKVCGGIVYHLTTS
jgi:hypothetical protein